jgi:hypothetical protein
LVTQIIASGFARPEAELLYEVVTRAEEAIPACFGKDLRR